ncbi:MAG: putative DNA binding domain-containing protein [Bacteroidetes bacterium]|nr:putative DNA binding domain-containing protein [Bacteroidota bacterium]
MNLSDIKQLITDGEGDELEFKRKVSSPEKIAKTISAFANTKGGIILFGIDDDGSLIGVESEKTEIDLIRSAGEYYCDPPVQLSFEYIPYHRREIIIVTIPESEQKPHFVKSNTEEVPRAYIRVRDNSVIASKEVIKVLRDERPETGPLKLIIGENEKRLFNYLEMRDRITVTQYSELVNVSHRRASRILTTLVRAGIIRIHTLEKEDYFTLASESEVFAKNHTKQFRTPRQH